MKIVKEKKSVNFILPNTQNLCRSHNNQANQKGLHGPIEQNVGAAYYHKNRNGLKLLTANNIYI